MALTVSRRPRRFLTTMQLLHDDYTFFFSFESVTILLKQGRKTSQINQKDEVDIFSNIILNNLAIRKVTVIVTTSSAVVFVVFFLFSFLLLFLLFLFCFLVAVTVAVVVDVVVVVLLLLLMLLLLLLLFLSLLLQFVVVEVSKLHTEENKKKMKPD